MIVCIQCAMRAAEDMLLDITPDNAKVSVTVAAYSERGLVEASR